LLIVLSALTCSHSAVPFAKKSILDQLIGSKFRCASLRVRILQADIEAVGIALRALNDELRQYLLSGLGRRSTS
jgi:hypothetical protein